MCIMGDVQFDLSRRSFIKGAAAGAAMLAASGLSLQGCAPSEGQSSDAKGSAEKQIPDTFTDGTYITESISMHGKVIVKTVISEGAIAEVSVLNHRESFVVGEEAVQSMPERIVESQCLDVDAVTGATITSTAIVNAVTEAVTNAGGDPELFKGYVAPAPETKTEEKTIDVAIMGGGPAGLMAAWELAEQGKSVTIFEKMPYVGGCTPLTGGGIYTAETDFQKAWGQEYCVERYSTFEKCFEFRQGQAITDHKYYNPEMPYLKNTILYSSKAVNKMMGIGVGFTPLDHAFAPVFAPGDFQIGCKYSIVFIEHYLTTKLGVEIIKEAPVVALTMDGDRVAGLVAQGVDGTTYRVAAKVVVLASGGYIMNDDLMKEYQPDEMKFTRMGPPWTTGDGMLLARDAGAQWICMDEGVTSHYHGATSLAEISYICNTVPGVIVDFAGARFVNESGDYKLYLHLFKEKPSTDFYWVFDSAAYWGLAPNGNSYGIDYRFLEETGDMIQGADYRELAEKYDMPDLVASLDAVNDCVLHGKKDELGNLNLVAMDVHNTMYAVKVVPTPYIAQGGVHIDLQGHVLREDGSALPGLYAAGDVTGAVDNLDGHPYNIGLSQAFGWGVLVGETIGAELS